MDKKIFIIGCLVAFAALASACGEKIPANEFRLEAQIDCTCDSVAVLTVPYGSTAYERKREALQDGRLVMTLPLEEPVSVTLRMPGDYFHMGINFPGVPGEKVVVNGSFEDYAIGGTRFYKEYAEVSDLTKPAMVKLGQMREDIENLFAELTKDREKNAERIREENEKYAAAYQEEYDELSDKAYAYALAHPDREAVAGLLSIVGTEHVEEVAAAMDPKVREGRMKKAIDAVCQIARNEQIRKEAEENIKEGAAAPDFTLPDIQGNSFTLSSLRGKWVVLDFWGSWCGWCIKGIPDMKKYYEKYAGKFEIVGIDCRDTEEKWKATVEKYGLPWLHVYNTEADGTPDKYAVQGYPTKIIIDPEGKIDKIVIGESEEFYKYLDTLFGE